MTLRGTSTDEDLIVLLAVRLRSRAPLEAIEATVESLGGDRRRVGRALDEAADRGAVRRRGSEGRRSLTPVGRAELAARLTAQLDAAGRAAIIAAYEEFLVVNREFLSALSAAPTGGAAGLAPVLGALVDRLRPVLEALTAELARFARYEARFVESLGRASRDPAWIDSASVDSVHTIWFELHEHLLASLGRDRTDER